MRGVFESRCSRNISSSPCNSSTPTPCLQLRQTRGYDCLPMHVLSPVGIVPRTTHTCLAINQSQVRQRLPCFHESRKQLWLLAHRLVTKFQPSARRQLCFQSAFHQLGHVQKDVIVVEVLLSVSSRASRADTIASSLLLGHSSL